VLNHRAGPRGWYGIQVRLQDAARRPRRGVEQSFNKNEMVVGALTSRRALPHGHPLGSLPAGPQPRASDPLSGSFTTLELRKLRRVHHPQVWPAGAMPWHVLLGRDRDAMGGTGERGKRVTVACRAQKACGNDE
jgi:hypothetical protein